MSEEPSAATASATRPVGRPGTGATPTPADATTPPPTAGRSVGRFRVERELGRGGMGVVLLAHDRDLGRAVAVKLMRADDPQAVARFRLEAHALAGLSHPNAVRVYEAGEADGRPFLAMEYVPGESLQQALWAGPLDARRAATVMGPVARAVQAAHAAGVLHRDLKPANVLLDPAGAAKVADFGLAKRLDRPADLTATGEAVGSPAYMAPEQARGDAADARTDVYGLGATLYECLTGRPPFAGPVAAVFQQVLHDDPVPPRRLNRAVPRDLETVCLKCLSKEPARRYATAGELADDLDRFLGGRSIVARPAGPAERAWRWGRRNRAVATLAVVAGLSLVGGATAAGVQAVRATAARDAEAEQRRIAEAKTAEAEADRRRAEDKAAEADAVTTFLLRDLLFHAGSRQQLAAADRPDPNVTVRQALDRAAARVNDRFAGRPAVAEAVRLTLSGAFAGVAEYAKAIDQGKRVVDARRARLGPDHPDTLLAALTLAAAYHGAGRHGEALPLAREAVRGRQAAVGPDHPDSLTAAHTLGVIHLSAGRPAEALPVLADCLRGQRAVLGPDHPHTLMTVNTLAAAHTAAGRPAEAVRLLEGGVRDRRRLFGPDHPDTADAAVDLATAYLDLGRAAEAVPLLQEGVRVRRTVFGPDHPKTQAANNNLAAGFVLSGRPAEAVPLLEESLRAARARVGPAGRDALAAATNLGKAYAGVKRWADAAPLFDAVLTAAPPDPGAVTRADLGLCLLRLGRFAEAEPHLLARHKAVAAGPPTAARMAARPLAELYYKWGKPAEAVKWGPEVAPRPRPARPPGP